MPTTNQKRSFGSNGSVIFPSKNQTTHLLILLVALLELSHHHGAIQGCFIPSTKTPIIAKSIIFDTGGRRGGTTSVQRTHPPSQRPKTQSAPFAATSSKTATSQRHRKQTDTQKTKKPRKFPPSTPRAIAAAALTEHPKVDSSGGDSFAVRRLENDPSFAALVDRRDRSFSRLLVATVERRMGQIDKVLGMCASVYPPKKGKHAAILQSCLRIGAAQLLFLNTPHHAAIKETVDVLRQQSQSIPEPMIKFVNAVLRDISRRGNDLLTNHTSTNDNIAPWLLDDWKQSWGDQIARIIAEQMTEEKPYIDLSLKQPPTTINNNITNENKSLPLIERLQFEFGNNNTILLPHGTLRVTTQKGTMISQWPLYDEGIWWVQDASAAIPALALRNALLNDHDDLSKRHVVDMCAAPGGKTAQLLSFGFGRVTAIEANAMRSRRLVDNLKRLRLTERCSLKIIDGRNWIPNREDGIDDDIVVDGILLDVPCSATGTARRRPDVLRKSPDLGHLLELQEGLANHCVDRLLSKGGVLVYATCSLLKRESEDQIRKLLGRGGVEEGAARMEPLPFGKGEIPGFDDAIDDDGWIRVLPGVLEGDLSSCDGFFVARLIKV